jgi:hypothetical protein
MARAMSEPRLGGAIVPKKRPPDVAPAARESVPPWRGYRYRVPDLLLRSRAKEKPCHGSLVMLDDKFCTVVKLVERDDLRFIDVAPVKLD